MNILIRCDAGERYGLGHAVRMKALAQELTARGGNVAFVSNTPESLSPFVTPFSCTHAATVALDPSSRDYHTIDVVIVDTTYPLEEAWYRGFGDALAGKMVRIDHPHATEGSCDLLVAPTAHWGQDTMRACADRFGAGFLGGWEYVMLTPGVVGMPPLPPRAPSRKGIVFCAGGSDPTGALDMMLEWSIRLEIATPLLFLRPCTQSRYLRAIRHASLVVGMFGVTAYESLWYRTPMLMYTRTAEDAVDAQRLQDMAPQQVWAGGVLTERCHPFDGTPSHRTAFSFCETVQDVYYASVGRITPGPAMLDGQGVARVAEAILALR